MNDFDNNYQEFKPPEHYWIPLYDKDQIYLRFRLDNGFVIGTCIQDEVEVPQHFINEETHRFLSDPRRRLKTYKGSFFLERNNAIKGAIVERCLNAALFPYPYEELIYTIDIQS